MKISLRTLLSGFALATSWTWCIGMFAPIVIGQLMGWPGILLFAIPNVLGCALFGYLRSADQSRSETRDHAWMCAIFSCATVAYQVFFAGWQWSPVLVDAMQTTRGEATVFAAGGVFVAAAALAMLPRHILWPLAAIAYLGSLTTFAFLPWSSMHALPLRGEWGAVEIALVAPTVIFGFMLSPNLDLTFHRARQECPAGATPTNFAVFGVTFASMLVLTACYLAASPGGLNNPAVRAHIAVQLVLTSALHLSELRLVALPHLTRNVLFAAAGIIGLVTAMSIPGRETYLRYLGLYGLLFPAYAALALRVGGRPTLGSVLALGVALAVATPIIDTAFIDRPSLAAPLAVVLPLAAIGIFGVRARTTAR